MRVTCKNPNCPRHGKAFVPKRAGAQYCSTACRVAAHRKRLVPPPKTWWLGKVPKFSATSRSLNADGSLALSRRELAEHLIEISRIGDDGKPKTGRRFYYLALSYGYIQPDMTDTAAGKASRDAAYGRVSDILGVLRRQSAVGWHDVLDLTRELDQWQTYGSPREARAALRRQYDEDRWQGQLYYPILIVEKDTMEPVCRPMAMKWQMPFASSRGYSSLTLQHDVADMLNRRRAQTGQVAIVYFVSDLDPSGLDLQRSWEQTLDDFGVVCIFVRIALIRDQVDDNVDVRGRPLTELSIEVKESDSRSASYIAQHGDRCWEADVLPASVIEQALDAEIDSWLNAKLWTRRKREIDQARSLL